MIAKSRCVWASGRKLNNNQLKTTDLLKSSLKGIG